MASNTDIIEQAHPQREFPALSSAKTRKTILLFVELVTILGLLAATFQLWQVRQSLAEDLAAAREVQSLLNEGEQTAPPGVLGGEASQTTPAGQLPYGSPVQPTASTDVQSPSDMLQAARGAVRGR